MKPVMHLQSVVADPSLTGWKTKRTGLAWPRGSPAYQCPGAVGNTAILLPFTSMPSMPTRLVRMDGIVATSYINREVGVVSP